jgi:hypothetical protein
MSSKKQPKWLIYLEIMALIVGIISGVTQIYGFVEAKTTSTSQNQKGW